MQSSAGIRRLAVHVDNTGVDVVLSAAVPLETLIPAITDALVATGEFSVGPAAARYGLTAAGGVGIDASKTLAELGIRDGTTLTLVRPADVLPPPQFDDAAEAVSAAVAEIDRPWSRRASRVVGALIASGLAVVSAAVLWRSALEDDDMQRTGCVVVAATISVLATLAAVIAYRVREDGAGLTLGLAAAAFAALAGWVAVPGGPGASNAVFAAAAATTSAAMIRMIGRQKTIFTTLMCFGAACCAAAVVRVLTGAALPAVGVGSAAVSLALIEAAPSVSIMLTQLPPAQVGDAVLATTIRAHTWLTSLIAAFSGLAALGTIGALSEPSPPYLLFAAVTGGVLLLRARTRHDIGQSAASIVCGAITLGAVLVAAALANPPCALYVAALSMMLSALALGAGLMAGATTIPAIVRRAIELVQSCALATVAPLALWLCGLYGVARGLNLS